MNKLKLLFNILDAFLAGIWGLTIIDLLSIVNVGDYNIIDDYVKTLFAAAGLLYLIGIKIPNEIVMNRLKRKEKRELIKKMEMENEEYKKNRDGSKKQD